jgi:hypothetical protein
MILTLIEIDGKDYHAEELFDDGGNSLGIEAILEEDGTPIPSECCLCHAYEPSECGCACTSWGNYYDYD